MSTQLCNPPKNSPTATAAAKTSSVGIAIGHNVPDFSTIVADRIEKVAVDAIRPARRRTRKHPKKQIANIMGSMRAFGNLDPIVIDEHNTIIVGHARWQAAKELGSAEIPVIRAYE